MVKKQNFDAAIKDFTKAMTIFPQNAMPYKLRSDAYQALGKPDLAEADLQKFKALGGN